MLKYELMPVSESAIPKYIIALNYQMNKSPLNFANREFVDKQMKFAYPDKSTVYCYYSAVPLERMTAIRELPPKVERARTIIGI